MSPVGATCAILSALFNGSFTVPSKFPRVLQANDSRFDPDTDERYKSVVFSFYTCVGVFLSSWLVVPFIKPAYEWNTHYSGQPELAFTYWGLVAGTLFVLAIGFSFAAIPLVGIALGQGVWGGTAILVSFLWGVLVFPAKNVVHSVPGTIGALVLLIGGVLCIAYCEQVGARVLRVLGGRGRPDAASSYAPLDGGPAPLSTARYTAGMACAGAVGIFGGSILIPMSFCAKEYQGLVFIPSFGIGAGAAGAVLAGAFFAAVGVRPRLHVGLLLAPGVLSGSIWNLGNIASVFAVQELGYSTAYPIMQCALFFAGLWGILVFREIRARAAIATFFVGGLVLLAGAFLLTTFVGAP